PRRRPRGARREGSRGRGPRPEACQTPSGMPGSDTPFSPTVVIAAGGTGGHIYPGLALADALGRVAPGSRISFTGTPLGMEGELVPAAGYDLDLYDMVQFNGQGWHKALAPPALVRSTGQAYRILGRREADVA